MRLNFENRRLLFAIALVLTQPLSTMADSQAEAKKSLDPFWNNAVVYFLLTDRFANADPDNDRSYDRQQDGAVLRSFMGGDIKGITEKITAGYFNALGVNVIWMTPWFEQVHGPWESRRGKSYSFHGYWPKDWTRVDANFGTEAELRELIAAAHRHGIRVLADIIINHTGPQTAVDPAWPNDWVRTEPLCEWNNYANNVACALADSLTDIRTESDRNVALPDWLLDKWRAEGRLAREQDELEAFFARTGLPLAPKYYIVKWLTDWVRDYGIDGFRVDTAKHVEADVWQVLKNEASLAFADWKNANPDQVMDDKDFFMLGEVYDYGLSGYRNTVPGTRLFDYGDKKVDFYDYGFDSLINMGFASHAELPMEKLFSRYSAALHDGPFTGVGVLNYLVSHDDPEPFDQERSRPYEAALKLLLAPGAAQIYYGDELARDLIVEGTYGDATLRSFMNWPDLENQQTQDLLAHWRKLGTFRANHLAVGAGVHQKLNDTPYIFSRKLATVDSADAVLVGIGLPKGKKVLPVNNVFAEGSELLDYYSNQKVVVKDGKIVADTAFDVVLLGRAKAP